ncbi:hypothetical protein Tco_0737056, partial [Tanacetum coccineum]
MTTSSPALKEKHDDIVTSHPSNIIVIFFTCVGSEDLFPDQQYRGAAAIILLLQSELLRFRRSDCG